MIKFGTNARVSLL